MNYIEEVSSTYNAIDVLILRIHVVRVEDGMFETISPCEEIWRLSVVGLVSYSS